MEPMGFARVLREYRLSECALDVLNDLDCLASVSLGYSSREHLCFLRNTVPAILLQEAEARAQACQSPDDVFAVLDVMHSYCHSQESIQFRPESPSTTFTTVTTTIIPTVTITCTVTRTPTPVLWTSRIMEAAGVCNAVPDTTSSTACCLLWIFTYAPIAIGPACFLAATAGALALELAWKLLKPQPSKADHAVGTPRDIKIGATAAGDPTPSHDPSAEAFLRAYGWALLLAASAYCLVIWFVSTTNLGAEVNLGSIILNAQCHATPLAGTAQGRKLRPQAYNPHPRSRPCRLACLLLFCGLDGAALSVPAGGPELLDCARVALLSPFMLDFLACVLHYAMPTGPANIDWGMYMIDGAWDTVIAVLTAYFWVETKGRTLEEINALF
ncbi:hypothetical protein DL766_003407 [Monosporascus sp. MC13-8B]|uniref:Uncharacterized protein n=1 Tax=Monosporascus cannonballus TaxID=155416 RepID=A0ABY0GVU8_9PEZI|nr:hypothetical protein DL762_008870 [Monosporascus cannonballus]RYP33571.1 hypothetical protein DL766_003407 [Monosporascus sp. MC13-8B]